MALFVEEDLRLLGFIVFFDDRSASTQGWQRGMMVQMIVGRKSLACILLPLLQSDLFLGYVGWNR